MQRSSRSLVRLTSLFAETFSSQASASGSACLVTSNLGPRLRLLIASSSLPCLTLICRTVVPEQWIHDAEDDRAAFLRTFVIIWAGKHELAWKQGRDVAQYGASCMQAGHCLPSHVRTLTAMAEQKPQEQVPPRNEVGWA